MLHGYTSVVTVTEEYYNSTTLLPCSCQEGGGMYCITRWSEFVSVFVCVQALSVYIVILQHSWKWFLYYCCQNINRHSKSDGDPSPKRLKVEKSAAHFLPPSNAEDAVSFKRNVELLQSELGKPKPRAEVLKDLMQHTFANRWDSYVNNSNPSTLLEYLSVYPLLKNTAYSSMFNCIRIFI